MSEVKLKRIVGDRKSEVWNNRRGIPRSCPTLYRQTAPPHGSERHLGVPAAINERLTDNPELINTDPYGAGWICKMETSMDDYYSLLDDDLIGEGPYVTHIETLRAVSKDVEKSDADREAVESVRDEIFDQSGVTNGNGKKDR